MENYTTEPRWNNSQKIAAGIVVAVILYLILSNLLRDDAPADDASASITTAQDASKLIEVEQLQAQSRTTHLTLYGETEANRLVKLKAQAEAQVEAIPATEGQPIKAGAVIMKLDVRDRLAKVEQAKAILEQRKMEYEVSQKLSSTGVDSPMKLARTKAAYAEAKAMLASAQEEYENTVIRAPFDGVLERINVKKGDLVGRGFVMNGDDTVATVVDNDPLVVVGMVPQQRRARLETGQNATVTLEGGAEMQGKVRYLATVTDPATRTFRVEIEIPNSDNAIPVGISANIRLPSGTEDAYFVAPSVLSLDDEGGVGVKTMDTSGKVHFQKVTILEDEPSGVWITGLEDTVNLITLGHNFVSDGEQLDPALLSAKKAEARMETAEE